MADEEKKLKIRLDALVDKIAEKMNWLLVQKYDKANVKGYLNSNNADYVPNIPAVNAGIAQAIIDASIYTDEQIDIVMLALDNKVDKIPGKGLSTNDFTDTLKQKLEELEGTKYRGAYPSLNALKQAYPEGSGQTWHNGKSGYYADVGVAGSDDVRYVWDPNDFVWIQSSLAGLTPEQVKQLYLQNSDTNNFSDFWLTKLQGIEDGAQKNVQSDWNQTNSNNDAFIKNKPTKLSQFHNDPNFVSQQWVLDQGFLDEHQSLAGYALLTDIKNGKLTLKAVGALSGGTKEFTANQNGNVEFAIDLNSVTKQKIENAYNGKINSMQVADGKLKLITQDNSEITIDLDELANVLELDGYIKGHGTENITISEDEPENPMHQDLWITKELRAGTGTYIASLNIEDPYFYENDTYWDVSNSENPQNVSFQTSRTGVGEFDFIQKRLYEGNDKYVSAKQEIPISEYAKKINRLRVYGIPQNNGWRHLVGHRRVIIDFIDNNNNIISTYDEYASGGLKGGDGLYVGVDEFENIGIPNGTKKIQLEVTTRSTIGSNYLGLGGVDAEVELDNTEFTPVWKIWDATTNEWLPFGGQDDNYPDYAQMLEDGLNF